MSGNMEGTEIGAESEGRWGPWRLVLPPFPQPPYYTRSNQEWTAKESMTLEDAAKRLTRQADDLAAAQAKAALADELRETLDSWEDDEHHFAWLKLWIARYDAIPSDVAALTAHTEEAK